MSRGFAIRADERFSVKIPTATLGNFIAQLPGVKPNGERGFALIADRVGWQLIDDCSDKPVPRGSGKKKPWWRFGL
jgi:hypothetical protein